MRIYIVRHGETTANAQGRLQGQTNDPLTEMGILLAEETGKAMRGIRFDAVFSSPLTRAKQTAEILLRESGQSIAVEEDERLLEIDMGDCEGKRFKGEDAEIDGGFVNGFLEDPLNVPPFPNGEHVRDVMGRTQAFLKELAGRERESVLVATHGCALRCMLNFLYENPADFWHGHVPYNCCVNIVEAADGKMRLVGDDVIYYDKRLCVDRYAKY